MNWMVAMIEMIFTALKNWAEFRFYVLVFFVRDLIPFHHFACMFHVPACGTQMSIAIGICADCSIEINLICNRRALKFNRTERIFCSSSFLCSADEKTVSPNAKCIDDDDAPMRFVHPPGNRNSSQTNSNSFILAQLSAARLAIIQKFPFNLILCNTPGRPGMIGRAKVMYPSSGTQNVFTIIRMNWDLI